MSKKILLTGASGYIGGRLLPRLLESGHSVRCFVRDAALIQSKFSELISRYNEQLDIFQGDALDEASVSKASKGMDILVYLIHSMGSKSDFAKRDALAATYFRSAAEKEQLEKTIYLGGLIDDEDSLSEHLKSRLEVGEIFRSATTPSITLRASIIIGSGSLSFELIRNLTERLPFMIAPKWVQQPAQAIAIRDVLIYLQKSIALSVSGHEIYEIGGKDIVSYEDLIREYAKQRSLKRFILRVPVLTPYLSSLWLGLVTPLYARIGRKLIESIKNATVVRKQDYTDNAFKHEPLGIHKAIALAIQNEEDDFVKTHWADALSSLYSKRPSYSQVHFGNRLFSSDRITFDNSVSEEDIFSVIESIGGNNGWYFATFIWKIRGFIDQLLGGPGLKRGRRSKKSLRQGDLLDWWRVDTIEKPRRLRLRAEMKVPGRAWLDFEIKNEKAGITLYQSAIFDPIGLFGRLYWYSLYPIHVLVFRGMLSRLQKEVYRRLAKS